MYTMLVFSKVTYSGKKKTLKLESNSNLISNPKRYLPLGSSKNGLEGCRWHFILQLTENANEMATKSDNMHCKCFVCYIHRGMPVNQIQRQLAVILTDGKL